MKSAAQTRLIDIAGARKLGSPDAAVSFSRPTPGQKGGPGTRHLKLDGADAFELSFWCGTCPLVFRRLYGANHTVSVEALQDSLNAGLGAIDDATLTSLSAVIPDGRYLPMLLNLQPRLVAPAGSGDYFSEEQVAHRGVDPFWRLPEYPATRYYRAGQWNLSETETLFEFIVPMVAPEINENARVNSYAEAMAAGAVPTGVGLSIVDRTQPFNSYDSHWGLTHFLLDGHHKFQAAAMTGARINLLSLLSLGDGLSGELEIERVRAALAGDSVIA